MRSIMRTVLVGGLALLALSVASVGVAAAVTPEFKPVPTKKKFTGSTGTVTFKTPSYTIVCAKSATTGEVTGARTVGKVVIVFTGCKSEAKSSCEYNSAGKANGEIVTKSLSGELGTVKTTEAPSGVGLLLKPEVENKWWVFEENSCTVQTTITGTLAGEVGVIGKKQATNKLVIKPNTIHKITLDSGKLEEPKLTAWSEAMTTEATDELSFEEALEVT
jgi:hypothetical protein